MTRYRVIAEFIVTANSSGEAVAVIEWSITSRLSLAAKLVSVHQVINKDLESDNAASTLE